MTKAEMVRDLGRKLDIKVMSAKRMNGRGGLYYRLERLEKLTGVEWTPLRGPVWVGDLVMMFMVRPRNDKAAYNRHVYPGECTNGWENG